jgi:hypothetical protein
MKRVIRYEVSSNKTEVFIGPVNEFAGKIWNLHEFGGRTKSRRRLKAHEFSPGEYGPIRIKYRGFNTKFARIRLRTASQAARATRLIDEENVRRQGQESNYPKRPFMKPALDTNRARLPKFWANSVN